MSLGRTGKPSRDLNPAHNFLLHASQRTFVKSLPNCRIGNVTPSRLLFFTFFVSVEDVGGDAILQRDRVGNQ